MKSKNYRTSQEDKKIEYADARKGFFEIHVKGHLDDSWSDWLDGLKITLLDNGEMKLTGYIGDQAALIGILNKVYSLNLALLSICEVSHRPCK